ncbi:DUF4905 domain-containing protein [Pontibacter diazotrophicus]|uniref:DUF4905 domain-containing protein n=1 Tax=Pontibacter diazotrophicus TaxID=1400979 RepID=A0A3D8L2V4_9BACT|nr:DUF4905 domain-containing protein [Pontibacter diazotrophicus]RDV11809.1 DUF4905 domain-containing protein [Pontibacter diazotrophicus]
MWRIRLDTAANRLALEVRDADLLLASFYTLDVSAYTLMPLPLPQAQSWWQGLEDAQGGFLFLHGYGDRKLGQHKGIRAIAAASGKVAWEVPELAFYGFVPDGVFAYPAATPEAPFDVLQLDTGQPVRTGVPQQQAADEVVHFGHTRFRNAVFPVLYLAGEAYFDEVKNFLSTQLHTAVVSGLEYAETDTALVVSYYERAVDNTLKNYVAVFDLDGSLLLKEQLADGLSGIGSDTFFIFMHDLYFIRNKTSLEVYRLLA